MQFNVYFYSPMCIIEQDRGAEAMKKRGGGMPKIRIRGNSAELYPRARGYGGSSGNTCRTVCGLQECYLSDVYVSAGSSSAGIFLFLFFNSKRR